MHPALTLVGQLRAHHHPAPRPPAAIDNRAVQRSTEIRVAILKVLEDGPASASELAFEIDGLNPSTAHCVLKRLAKAGTLRAIEGVPVRYALG